MIFSLLKIIARIISSALFALLVTIVLIRYAEALPLTEFLPCIESSRNEKTLLSQPVIFACSVESFFFPFGESLLAALFLSLIPTLSQREKNKMKRRM